MLLPVFDHDSFDHQFTGDEEAARALLREEMKLRGIFFHCFDHYLTIMYLTVDGEVARAVLCAEMKARGFHRYFDIILPYLTQNLTII